MAQGGLHRGVAVCRGNAGPPVTQPLQGSCALPYPNPLHLVFCTSTSWGGDIVLSDARPGQGHNRAWGLTQWPSARGLMSRGATGPALRCNAGQP